MGWKDADGVFQREIAIIDLWFKEKIEILSSMLDTIDELLTYNKKIIKKEEQLSLKKYERYAEDMIIELNKLTPVNDEDLEKFFYKLVSRVNSLNESFYRLLGTMEGVHEFSFDQHQKHIARTEKSTKMRRLNRAKKADYVMKEYNKLINNLDKRNFLRLCSETALAKGIKKEIEPELKNNKVCNSISIDTIINILRTRDKEKYPYYPWDKKEEKKLPDIKKLSLAELKPSQEDTEKIPHYPWDKVR